MPRDPELEARDVAPGYYTVHTVEQAEALFDVVLDRQGRPDLAATARRRDGGQGSVNGCGHRTVR